MLIRVGRAQADDTGNTSKKWNSKTNKTLSSVTPKPKHVKKQASTTAQSLDAGAPSSSTCMTFCGVCKFSMVPRVVGCSIRLTCVNKSCVGQDSRLNTKLRTSRSIGSTHKLLSLNNKTIYNTSEHKDNKSSTTHEIETCKTDMSIPIINIQCSQPSCTSKFCYRPSPAAQTTSTLKMRYVCCKCRVAFEA